MLNTKNMSDKKLLRRKIEPPPCARAPHIVLSLSSFVRGRGVSKVEYGGGRRGVGEGGMGVMDGV